MSDSLLLQNFMKPSGFIHQRKIKPERAGGGMPRRVPCKQIEFLLKCFCLPVKQVMIRSKARKKDQRLSVRTNIIDPVMDHTGNRLKYLIFHLPLPHDSHEDRPSSGTLTAFGNPSPLHRHPYTRAGYIPGDILRTPGTLPCIADCFSSGRE